MSFKEDRGPGRTYCPNLGTGDGDGRERNGKELIAYLLHQLSQRSGRPYVRVNCAALSDTLLESELFGHEKGAFTGAVNRRKGRFGNGSWGNFAP